MIPGVRGLESRSLTLRGDPGACRDSAVDVQALAVVVEEVAAYLLTHRDLDGSAAGRWASAYGGQCRRGVDLADVLATRCRAVVGALVAAADLLDGATHDLADVRGLAADHGLLLGNRLVPPPPTDPAPTWEAWRRADALVTSVRGAERAARHGVERALEVSS